jgi:hypothetical protein
MILVGIQAWSICRPRSLALGPFQAGRCAVRICEPPWYCAVVVAMAAAAAAAPLEVRMNRNLKNALQARPRTL